MREVETWVSRHFKTVIGSGRKKIKIKKIDTLDDITGEFSNFFISLAKFRIQT